MTEPQLAILVLLLSLLVVFAIDRFRIELVALAGLAAGICVPAWPNSTGQSCSCWGP
jgi:hypothetical protein